jgi:hypothetical protein
LQVSSVSINLQKHCLTTPMHADRRELVGYDAKVICSG